MPRQKVKRVVLMNSALRSTATSTGTVVNIDGALDVRVAYRNSLNKGIAVSIYTDLDQAGTFTVTGTTKTIATNTVAAVGSADANWGTVLSMRGGSLKFVVHPTSAPASGVFYMEAQITRDA